MQNNKTIMMTAKGFYDEMGGSAQYSDWDLDDPVHSDKDMIEFSRDYRDFVLEDVIHQIESPLFKLNVLDELRKRGKYDFDSEVAESVSDVVLEILRKTIEFK